MWVRTRDWVKQWDQTASPGRFELLLNGKALEVTFGTERAEWHWQDGGTICLKTGENRVELRDLTGFDGRCDAIFFTSALEMLPPDGKDAGQGAEAGSPPAGGGPRPDGRQAGQS